jgi:hypothetical protein
MPARPIKHPQAEDQALSNEQKGEGRKQVFFAKKNQKTCSFKE